MRHHWRGICWVHCCAQLQRKESVFHQRLGGPEQILREKSRELERWEPSTRAPPPLPHIGKTSPPLPPHHTGTGKTFMLNQIIEDLRRKYGRAFGSKVALAAPTGIAATHIQGGGGEGHGEKDG